MAARKRRETIEDVADRLGDAWTASTDPAVWAGAFVAYAEADAQFVYSIEAMTKWFGDAMRRGMAARDDVLKFAPRGTH